MDLSSIEQLAALAGAIIAGVLGGAGMRKMSRNSRGPASDPNASPDVAEHLRGIRAEQGRQSTALADLRADVQVAAETGSETRGIADETRAAVRVLSSRLDRHIAAGGDRDSTPPAAASGTGG